MEDYIKRMTEELHALYDNIKRVDSFIESAAFCKLDKKGQRLMIELRAQMKSYHTVLKKSRVEIAIGVFNG